MNAGRRGSSRERQVMAKLRADGWIVYRAAGSHGCADLVALKNGRYGAYVQLGETPEGKKAEKPKRASLQAGMTDATVTLDQALQHRRTGQWQHDLARQPGGGHARRV